MLVRQGASEFVETILMIDHLLARVAGHRILVLKEDRFLGADLLAEPAVNAAQHVDVERLRTLFNVLVSGAIGDLTGCDADCFWRTDELAELARDALFPTVRILHERRDTAIILR